VNPREISNKIGCGGKRDPPLHVDFVIFGVVPHRLGSCISFLDGLMNMDVGERGVRVIFFFDVNVKKRGLDKSPEKGGKAKEAACGSHRSNLSSKPARLGA
jgi:hypothetical protein